METREITLKDIKSLESLEKIALEAGVPQEVLNCEDTDEKLWGIWNSLIGHQPSSDNEEVLKKTEEILESFWGIGILD